MNKKGINYFVSYAHSNKKAALVFLEKFEEQTGAAKLFDYSRWDDRQLTVGEKWDKGIQEAIKKCDFGLILVSPALLASQYVKNKELPKFLSSEGKRCFPIMLAEVDFKRHDLLGLESLQIFRLDFPKFKEPRAFTACKEKRKEDFVRELFAKVHDWLEENYNEN